MAWGAIYQHTGWCSFGAAPQRPLLYWDVSPLIDELWGEVWVAGERSKGRVARAVLRVTQGKAIYQLEVFQWFIN